MFGRASGSIDAWHVPQVIWRALDHLGISVAQVIRRAGAPELTATDQEAPLTTAQIMAIWRSIESVSGDPIVGLRMVQASRDVGADVAFLAGFHAATYRDALRNIAEHKRVHSPERLESELKGNLLYVRRHVPHATVPEPIASVDYSFGTLLGIGRIGTNHPINAVRVELARPRPSHGVYERFFGARIRYDAPADMLVLDTVDLARPFISHDPELLDISLSHLKATIRRRVDEIGLVERVSGRIREDLGKGTVTVASIARALAISERSLQRQLEAHGTTFADLLTQTRHQLACNLLAETADGLDVIAHRLGYANAASFSRAFQSWGGTAPGRWRRQTGL